MSASKSIITMSSLTFPLTIFACSTQRSSISAESGGSYETISVSSLFSSFVIFPLHFIDKSRADYHILANSWA